MILKGEKIVSIFWLTVTLSSTLVHSYSREELQELYPGFGTEYILFPDENNEPIVGYLTMENSSRLFGIGEPDFDKDVNFVYFSRQSPEGIPLTSIEDLSKYIDKSKPVKSVTHGWMSGGTRDACVQIRKGFLKKYDANVLVMDWSEISGNIFYPIPMMMTPKVGKHYGRYLNYMVDEVGVDPQDIHLVGHSLGAHISGFAGREVKKGKIGRVTGLDPALPGFDTGMISSGTMNKNDASFVDVIHTCAGFLGYKYPLGHADFYPNGGGPPQPGCTLTQLLELCSHKFSWRIFASSLLSEEPQIASKCATFDEIEKNKYCAGAQIPAGDATPTNATGIYYAKILSEDLVVFE